MSRRANRATLTLSVGPHDHTMGHADAPLTLVEYGDFQCPYCRKAHPIVKELQRRMGAKLRFVFRNFPLSQVHPNAEHAAEVAEAAAVQGVFWPMHDRLYERQFALEDEDLLAYAADLGLDAERIGAELQAGTYEPQVRDDFMSGVKSGVNGTPTFFINGVRHDADYEVDTLMAALEAALPKGAG